ncbi:NUDIX domain-containing protein [Actinoplanes sp. NPDC049802]|uniref:NUDIX hydrolase n=1 Tax=Actinoplanes sp. NPDC049802 TaxID=3154742 RepID=UPI0033C5C107
MTVPTHPVDVLLLLADGDRVLLGLRDGTGYADGCWVLPSGKLEIGEDVVTAVVRETAEEVGIRLTVEEVRLAATVHHRSVAGQGRIGLVFAVEYEPALHGEPVNAEPHKCAQIAWFPADRLPASTYPSTAAGVAAWRDGEPLRLSGWQQHPRPASGRGPEPLV